MKHRLGIVGGGQLGRMLAFEAKKLGFTVTVIDPTPNSPAGQVADHQIVADFKDEAAIKKLAQSVDFLTFEIELAQLPKTDVVVNPSIKTLTIIKDKLKQKQFLRAAKIPVAAFMAVTTKSDILQTARQFRYPLLLKARFDAYDGRGNALINSASDIDGALAKLDGRQLYVEQFVPFTKELAVMVAISTTGEIAVYPVVETIHKNNICHTVIAPAPITPTQAKQAQVLATQVVSNLHGAGVFGIEMFLTKNGEVLVNEIAPRVHNSGHYTIEACVTSQFEQHIRAVTGLPLGSTAMLPKAAVMVNILGDRIGASQATGLDKALSLPGVSVHIYGKHETKLERKMGHITAIADNTKQALLLATKARKYISI